MALPKLQTVTYELELPSSGEKIKFRPFLVKEQKVLMIAQESEDEAAIQNAIADTIKSCTFDKVDPWTAPAFDLEYIFLHIRGKSVGEILDITVLCPDDGETRVPVKVNLEDVDLKIDENHTNTLVLNKDVIMKMKYPNMKNVTTLTKNTTTDTEHLFGMVRACIDEIQSGDEVYQSSDLSSEELEEFICNQKNHI